MGSEQEVAVSSTHASSTPPNNHLLTEEQQERLFRMPEPVCPRTESTSAPVRVYVASSWRNEARQQSMVRTLRAAGYEVYDFRNPAPGSNGFGWSRLDPDWQRWTPERFRRALEHPVAVHGFGLDMDALRTCDACVLVQPCGRSAHLEVGWAAGAGKVTVALLAEGQEPELMLNMVQALCLSEQEVLRTLAVYFGNMGDGAPPSRATPPAQLEGGGAPAAVHVNPALATCAGQPCTTSPIRFVSARWSRQDDEVRATLWYQEDALAPPEMVTRRWFRLSKTHPESGRQYTMLAVQWALAGWLDVPPASVAVVEVPHV